MKKFQLIQKLLDNPIIKCFLRWQYVEQNSMQCFLRWLVTHCKIDKKSRIDVGIEIYAGLRKKGCWKCMAIGKALSLVFKLASMFLMFDETEFRQSFKNNPYLIKNVSAVIKGVAVFGLKTPFVSGNPMMVFWEITHACNLKCKHCAVDAGKKTTELSTQEVLKVIDKLNEFGVATICFSGGEPLIRPDIFKLTKYAAEKGINVGLFTNGILVTEKKAQEIKEAGIKYVRVSLDSHNERKHDSFRGVKGAFNQTIKGVKNILGKKISVSLCMTVTKQNYNEIPMMINLCEKLGVNRLIVDDFVPTGRGKEMEENYDLTSDEKEIFLKELYRLIKTSKIEIVAAFSKITAIALEEDNCEEITPTYMMNLKSSRISTILAELIGGCPAGRIAWYILPNGDIHPCGFLKLTLGNVRQDDLEKIWRENHILSYLRNRDILQPNCGTCKYRYVCGGCRTRAYELSNDFLAPDPGCVRNKAKSKTMIDKKR